MAREQSTKNLISTDLETQLRAYRTQPGSINYPDITLATNPISTDLETQLRTYWTQQGNINYTDTTLVTYENYSSFERAEFSLSALFERAENGNSAIEVIFGKAVEHNLPVGRVRRVLITGDAGSGKKYLLEHIGRSWASGQPPYNKFDVVLPVDLTVLSKEHTQDTTYWGVAAIIANTISLRSGTEPSEELGNEVVRLLNDSSDNLLLLVSGYDRVLYADKTDHIIELLSNYPNVIFVSRPIIHITESRFTDEFPRRLELLGFSQQQAEQYTQNYFQEQRDLATRVIERIRTNDHIFELSRIPKQLELICRKTAELLHVPESVLELFGIYKNLAEEYTQRRFKEAEQYARYSQEQWINTFSYEEPKEEEILPSMSDVITFMGLLAEDYEGMIISPAEYNQKVEKLRPDCKSWSHNKRMIFECHLRCHLIHFGLIRLAGYDNWGPYTGYTNTRNTSVYFIADAWRQHFKEQHLTSLETKANSTIELKAPPSDLPIPEGAKLSTQKVGTIPTPVKVLQGASLPLKPKSHLGLAAQLNRGHVRYSPGKKAKLKRPHRPPLSSGTFSKQTKVTLETLAQSGWPADYRAQGRLLVSLDRLLGNEAPSEQVKATLETLAQLGWPADYRIQEKLLFSLDCLLGNEAPSEQVKATLETLAQLGWPAEPKGQTILGQWLVDCIVQQSNQQAETVVEALARLGWPSERRTRDTLAKTVFGSLAKLGWPSTPKLQQIIAAVLIKALELEDSAEIQLKALIVLRGVGMPSDPAAQNLVKQVIKLGMMSHDVELRTSATETLVKLRLVSEASLQEMIDVVIAEPIPSSSEIEGGATGIATVASIAVPEGNLEDPLQTVINETWDYINKAEARFKQEADIRLAFAQSIEMVLDRPAQLQGSVLLEPLQASRNLLQKLTEDWTVLQGIKQQLEKVSVLGVKTEPTSIHDSLEVTTQVNTLKQEIGSYKATLEQLRNGTTKKRTELQTLVGPGNQGLERINQDRGRLLSSEPLSQEQDQTPSLTSGNSSGASQTEINVAITSLQKEIATLQELIQQQNKQCIEMVDLEAQAPLLGDNEGLSLIQQGYRDSFITTLVNANEGLSPIQQGYRDSFITTLVNAYDITCAIRSGVVQYNIDASVSRLSEVLNAAASFTPFGPVFQLASNLITELSKVHKRDRLIDTFQTIAPTREEMVTLATTVGSLLAHLNQAPATTGANAARLIIAAISEGKLPDDISFDAKVSKMALLGLPVSQLATDIFNAAADLYYFNYSGITSNKLMFAEVKKRHIITLITDYCMTNAEELIDYRATETKLEEMKDKIARSIANSGIFFIKGGRPFRPDSVIHISIQGKALMPEGIGLLMHKEHDDPRQEAGEEKNTEAFLETPQKSSWEERIAAPTTPRESSLSRQVVFKL